MIPQEEISPETEISKAEPLAEPEEPAPIAEEKAAEEALKKDKEVNMVDLTSEEEGLVSEESAGATDAPEEDKKPASKSDATTGNEDFDWDVYGADVLEETAENHQKLEEMYSDTLSTIAENEVIDGTVISMNKREVVINIGYKSEGVVSLNEFRYNPD